MVGAAPAQRQVGAGPRARDRRRRVALLGVLAAAIVVASALVLVGPLRPAGTGPATTTGPWDFPASAPRAEASDRGVAGGPWTIVVALGIVVSAPLSLSETSLVDLLDLENCTLGWIGSAGGSVDVPATLGAPNGTSEAWLFAASNGTGMLLTYVANSTAQPLALASGVQCSLYAADSASITDGSTVGSPDAVSTANQAGGELFLGAHADATRLLLAFGEDYGVTETWWSVGYTTCSLSAPFGGAGATFSALIHGNNGDLAGAPTTSDNCTAVAPALP